VTNPAQSRFQIIPAGSAPYPNKCAVCGSVERDLIDFGLTFDFEGAVMFCTDCCAELASKIGWIKPQQYLEAVKEAANIRTNLDRAVAEVTRFVNVFVDSSNALGTSVDLLLKSPAIVDATEPKQDFIPIFGSPGEEGPASYGSDGQDDRNAGDEGPVSVPASSSDESKFDGPNFTF